ncbi:hypothetical protein BSLG_000413 [Batrachochytrium salamandrivorans]|nr:hypothetical protein BSLG_000413 [Batrachochytrium salamandrivorans]
MHTLSTASPIHITALPTSHSILGSSSSLTISPTAINEGSPYPAGQACPVSTIEQPPFSQHPHYSGSNGLSSNQVSSDMKPMLHLKDQSILCSIDSTPQKVLAAQSISAVAIQTSNSHLGTDIDSNGIPMVQEGSSTQWDSQISASTNISNSTNSRIPKRKPDRISSGNGIPRKRKSVGSSANRLASKRSVSHGQTDFEMVGPGQLDTSSFTTGTLDTRKNSNSDGTQSTPTEEMDSKVDDALPQLFCICQKPYDEKKFYIQCDKCDDWFHGSCMHVSEAESESIDKWYCAACRAKTGLQNVWKVACKKPTCKKFARVDSIYCSDECGIAVATKFLHSRIESLLPLRARTSLFSKTPKLDRYQSYTELRTQTIQEIRSVKSLIRALETRQRYIDDAVERAYQLNTELAASQITTSNSGSRSDRASANHTCGFDRRIVGAWLVNLDRCNIPDKLFEAPLVEDAEIETVDTVSLKVRDECKDQDHDVSSPFEQTQSSFLCPTMCLNRGRCLRHDGWEFSKPREVELELDEQLALLLSLKLKRAALDVRLRYRA